jgi:hypothetical protein
MSCSVIHQLTTLIQGFGTICPIRVEVTKITLLKTEIICAVIKSNL